MPSRITSTNIFRPRNTVPGQPNRAAPSMPYRHMFNELMKPDWSDLQEIRIEFTTLNLGWNANQIHMVFAQYGIIRRIELWENTRQRSTSGYIVFSPPPTVGAWLTQGIVVQLHQRQHKFTCSLGTRGPIKVPHPQNRDAEILRDARLPLSVLKIGVMEKQDQFLALYTCAADPPNELTVLVDAGKRCIDLTFTLRTDSVATTSEFCQDFKISTRFDQVKTFRRIESGTDTKTAFLMTLHEPPYLYRGATNASSHDSDGNVWTDSRKWARECSIRDPPNDGPHTLRLLDRGLRIDTGRWLTYTFELDVKSEGSKLFLAFEESLKAHDLALAPVFALKMRDGGAEELWHWDNGLSTITADSRSSSLDLHQLTNPVIKLGFGTQYQLEVCLSERLIHECNITTAFMQRLVAEDVQNSTNDSYNSRGRRLLEAAAEEKERIYDPMAIFDLTPKAPKPTIPKYCASIPAAVITPTTFYLATPVVETSNRVVRQFQHYENRFLRVRFADERYSGRIQSVSEREANRDEIFNRIKNVMTHGIQIGDRHYDFLAFGNSQFREHGAYFFASTSTLGVAQIRQWMGDFGHIRVIAKYASRLGLCLSTTRTMSLKVINLEKIPEIERNGYTFSDGVGKISPFLAQMLASELGFPHTASDCPSVFQFRLGGCKGVLAVDPGLRGNVVQIRPSQEKFAAKYLGLEVCRVSQYSSACLNMQLILVLSKLGVDDNVFLDKMRTTLQELDDAMTDESKAITKLSRNIDFNQITLVLAQMLRDGFMRSGDPFMLSCLQLWRSWIVKYLKSKARLYIEQGAMLLGCLDETGTLRGHYNQRTKHDTTNHDPSLLPEIFVQISSDPSRGRQYEVIKGVCLLARNPSLHPGDVRVVRAVDVSALHHLKDCVVLPQTGDRDVSSMCSGGDLDGDDYLVIWDKSLLPTHWNWEPMAAEVSEPITSSKAVTVCDITSFFVRYMKDDNLGRIGAAHRYWADRQYDGVNSPQCLELARLHSIAVDYAKTGVPAMMPPRLYVQQWPHWSEPHNKPESKVYHSRKVLGKLYDEVQHIPFAPKIDGQFDSRILNAFKFGPEILQTARATKKQYDEALIRIMAINGIRTEFEAWTTFALEHAIEGTDYKFGEKFGQSIASFKELFQNVCFEKAGTTRQGSSREKLLPFIAAMYKVTADEVEERPDGQTVLISFPWLFPRELGNIAADGVRQTTVPRKNKEPDLVKKKLKFDLLTDSHEPKAVTDVALDQGVVHEGDLLDLYHQDSADAILENLEQESDSENEEVTIEEMQGSASAWNSL